MLPQAEQLLLVGTELLCAVLTAKVVVGALAEPLRVPEEGQLPPEQQGHGQSEKAPGVGLLDEEQRREHHGVVPVVDAAGAAALVLHEPGLDRAEEQDTDHVAHGVGAAEQDHDAVTFCRAKYAHRRPRTPELSKSTDSLARESIWLWLLLQLKG